MAEEATTLQDDTTQASETTASTQAPIEETTTEESVNNEAAASETEAPASEKKAEESGILEKEPEDNQEEKPTTFEWKMPEGVELSEEDSAALNKLAEDNKLSPEEAPKAFEFAKQMHEAIEKDIERAAAEELDKMKQDARKEWEAQTDAATKTLHMQKFLKQQGLLNHFIDSNYETDVKLMGAIAEAGKLISEATHITGVDTAPRGDQVLYANSPELYNK